MEACPTGGVIEYNHCLSTVYCDSKVLGTNVEKTEKRQGKKPDSYKDYRRILERKDIDAVMIAKPDQWHTKVAVEAMYAGKDVYCEKPLTLTIAEGKLIEKVVKDVGPGVSRLPGTRGLTAIGSPNL
jgi:predicted dehydrogenase